MGDFRIDRVALAISAALLSVLCVPGVQASVRISKKPTANMSCTSGVCTATARNAVLNASDLAGMLASGDVTVASGHIAKDIDVTVSLSWVSSHRLTVDSYTSITFSKVVDVAGPGAMTMTTNDGGSGGDIYFSDKGRVHFRGAESSLIINGHSYVLIDSIRELKNVSDNHSPYIALVKNINAGKPYSNAPVETLEATLEGLGHSISNLTISGSQNQEPLGLVGTLLWNGAAAIRDLHLINVDIQGTLEGDRSVGTLVGANDGGFIIGASATGQVSSSGANAVVGGLIGYNTGAVVRSSAAVSVTAGSTGSAGGLVGQATGFGGPNIIQSYATGSVTAGDGTSAGGLVGLNEAGGIQNSYASGTVTGGNGAFVGGLVGTNSNEPSSPMIQSSYSTGAVSADSGADVGGLFGQDLAQAGTTNAYWDMDTSGVSNPSQGAGNVPNDPGVTGLTSVQLQSGLPTGFASSVWTQSPTVNSGFPYLADNPPQ